MARNRTHTEATLDPSRPLSTSADTLGAGRYSALYETGRQLLEQRDPRQVLATVHRAILDHLQPDRAAVLSLDSAGAFHPVSTHALELSGPEDLWPVSFSVIRQVVETGLSVLASDARSDPQFEDAESIQRFRIRSILCVPLGRPARGVVYLDNRSARPFQTAELEFLTALAVYAALALERALELTRASAALQHSADRLDVLQGELLRHRIVGSAPPLLAAYDALRRFAKSGARVLLRGETGTGKELFARAYAAESGRAHGAYIPVPIPALAPGLVESELFGHVRGAFTEATRDKKGRLEVAHGGVLFLDEIGDIEPPLQVKLLRFLDSGELFRVGDNEPRKVDALVVSATNRPLEKDVEQGRFRADLLARLGHAIRIPPLRERVEDIPELLAHFLDVYDRGRPKKTFAPETLAVLQRHAWPFNVRELQQVVESTVCLVDEDVVRPEHLPEYLGREASASPVSAAGGGTPGPMRKAVEEAERAAILRALTFTGGNRRKAIELLQVSPETFYKRLEEFGLK